MLFLPRFVLLLTVHIVPLLVVSVSGSSDWEFALNGTVPGFPANLVGRYGSAAAAVGGDQTMQIIVHGGYNGGSGGFLDDLVLIDLAQNKATVLNQGSPLPSGRYHHAAQWVGGTFMTCQGFLQGLVRSDDCWKYRMTSTAGGTWTQLTNVTGVLPAVFGPGTSVDNTSRFFLTHGGSVSTFIFSNELWRVDVSGVGTAENVSSTGDVPSARDGTVLVRKGQTNAFLLLGGYDGSTYLFEVYRLDLNGLNGSWTQLTSSAGWNRAGFGIGMWNALHNVALIGFGDDGDSVTNNMYVSDDTGSTWTLLSSNGMDVPSARRHVGYASVELANGDAALFGIGGLDAGLAYLFSDGFLVLQAAPATTTIATTAATTTMAPKPTSLAAQTTADASITATTTSSLFTLTTMQTTTEGSPALVTLASTMAGQAGVQIATGDDAAWIFVFLAIGAVILIAAIFAVVLFLRRRSHHAHEVYAPSITDHELSLQVEMIDPLSTASSRLENNVRNEANNFLKASQSKELFNITMDFQLGEGAFGQVWHGSWNETEVACKLATGDASRGELLAEAALLSGLRHANIVLYLGHFFNERDTLFLVFEFAQHGSALQKVQGARLDYPAKLRMLLDAARGMLYLAEAGIIHRDLSCRNMLVATGGVVKIADFGLSRSMTNEYYKTTGGAIPVRWSAPEVLRQSTSTTKSDVYSFGITMHELLSDGTVPFIGETNASVSQIVTSGEAAQYLVCPAGCPTSVHRLLIQCIAFEPSERPSMQLVLRELLAICQQECGDPTLQASFSTRSSGQLSQCDGPGGALIASTQQTGGEAPFADYQ